VKPRLSILVGVIFVILAIVFYLAPVNLSGNVDIAGVTMILALSAAMSMMFYVLMAGTPRDT